MIYKADFSDEFLKIAKKFKKKRLYNFCKVTIKD